MNPFADGTNNASTFLIKNNSRKNITLFGISLKPGYSYNLMDLQGVTENDIKVSLLKGVLKRKLNIGEISILSSDLSLLTNNSTQNQFIKNTLGYQGPIVTDSISSPKSRGNNCLFFVNGDVNVTQTSNLVSNWTDQSRQGDANRNFVASGSFRPTYINTDPNYNNKGTLSFNGTTNYMAAGTWTSPPSQPYTIYIVGESQGSSGVFFGSGAGSNRSDVDISASKIHAYAGSNLTSTTSVSSKSVIAVVFNGASSAIYVNNSQVAVSIGDVGAQTISQTNVGANFAGGNLLNGKVAAITVIKGAESARARAEMFQYFYNYYSIDNTDSLNKKLIICDGDSLTSGTGSTGGNTYPNQLITLLGSSNYEVINDGTGGHKITDLLSGASTIDEYITTIARPKNYYIGWAGTNDIYTSGTDAAVCYSNYVSLLSGRRSSGTKVIACTLLPRTNTSTPSYQEHQRQQLNAMIRQNWYSFADALADFGNDPIIGLAGSEMDTAYYDTDRVHMTNSGYAIIASIAKTALLSII